MRSVYRAAPRARVCWRPVRPCVRGGSDWSPDGSAGAFDGRPDAAPGVDLADRTGPRSLPGSQTGRCADTCPPEAWESLGATPRRPANDAHTCSAADGHPALGAAMDRPAGAGCAGCGDGAAPRRPACAPGAEGCVVRVLRGCVIGVLRWVRNRGAEMGAWSGC